MSLKAYPWWRFPTKAPQMTTHHCRLWTRGLWEIQGPSTSWATSHWSVCNTGLHCRQFWRAQSHTLWRPCRGPEGCSWLQGHGGYTGALPGTPTIKARVFYCLVSIELMSRWHMHCIWHNGNTGTEYITDILWNAWSQWLHLFWWFGKHLKLERIGLKLSTKKIQKHIINSDNFYKRDDWQSHLPWPAPPGEQMPERL